MDTVHPIRAYRTRRGITQEALAGELGVSPITVSRWEIGTRKIDDDLLPTIASKTGISPSELRPDLAALLLSGEESK